MKMVITLKSGQQIKADVEKFEAKRNSCLSRLEQLDWTEAKECSVRLGFVDLNEIAAIHTEILAPR